VTGARNFFRTIGGAFGLAICSAILNNTLSSRLAQDPSISPEVRDQILSSAFQLPDNLTAEELASIMNAYAAGIRGIFIMFVPLGALSFLLSLFVVDVGLPDDAKDTKANATSDGSSAETVNAEEEPTAIADQDIPEAIPPVEKIEISASRELREEEIHEKTV